MGAGLLVLGVKAGIGFEQGYAALQIIAPFLLVSPSPTTFTWSAFQLSDSTERAASEAIRFMLARARWRLSYSRSMCVGFRQHVLGLLSRQPSERI